MASLEPVTIVVDDYDPAIEFFVDVLRFELVDDSPSLSNVGRPKRGVVVRPPGAQTGILLGRQVANIPLHMQSLRPLLLVGLGGFLGSAGRYAVGGLVHRLLPFVTFPVGTLVVNVAGCALIGVAAGLVDARQLFTPDVRIFLMVGVLGGFTTFSSFAYETLALARDASFARAFANVAAQVLLGLAAAWLGYAAGRG